MRTITVPTFTTGKTLTENNTLRVRVNAGDGMKGGECQTYRKGNALC